MSYRLVEPDVDPLSSKQAILINAVSEFHGKYIYILVPVQDKGVAIGLATRA
jgi:hypothetical protein